MTCWQTLVSRWWNFEPSHCQDSAKLPSTEEEGWHSTQSSAVYEVNCNFLHLLSSCFFPSALAKLDEVLSVSNPPQYSLVSSQKHPPPGSLLKTNLFQSLEATPMSHPPSTSALVDATHTSMGSSFGRATPPRHTEDLAQDPQVGHGGVARCWSVQ